MRLLGLATLVLALAAACGGNGDGGASQVDYERQLQALPDLFAGDECAVPDPVEALEARQAALAEQIQALEALEPPEEVAEAHAALLAAHRAQADALDGALEQVRALPDPGEAETRDAQAQAVAEGFGAAERAAPDPAALAAAQRSFGEAGYTLAPPELEPEEYEARANEIVAEISPIALADAATMAELQAAAERVGLELVAAAGRLEELVPPAVVGEAHEHLALGVCTRGQELLLFARFGGIDPDEPAETDALREVIATLDPFFEEAAGDYRDRGYDVAVPEVETGR